MKNELPSVASPDVFGFSEQEQRVNKFAPLLGGIFEIGGSARLKVEQKSYFLSSGERRSIPRVVPVLEFNDNNDNNIEKLYEMFGGSTVPHASKNSRRWYLKDRRAIIMAENIAPFAPSRREFYDACINLANSTDIEEKLRIAQDFRIWNENRFKDISQDEYAKLVQNPLFLAGVLMGRKSSIYRYPTTKIPTACINAENIKLMVAIQQEFGGHISELKHASEEEIKSGKLSAQLRFDQVESQRLHNEVNEFLKANIDEYGELLAA